jgi:uncharacterized protein (TIGR02466 family)
MNQINVVPLFATPVAMFTLDVDNAKILESFTKLSYKLIKEEDEFLNKHAYIGTDYTIINKFPELKASLEESLDYYIKHILQFKAEGQLIKSWATKTGPGGYSNAHRHSNSWLTGCYYPLPEADTQIEFLRETPFEYDTERIENNLWNSYRYRITAIPNQLLIWPSYLLHRIRTNTGKQDRYSMAFSALPKGSFGQMDSLINFSPDNS